MENLWNHVALRRIIPAMNSLGDLLRARRDELRRRGDTVRKIAERGGLAESVVYDHLKRTRPYRQTPFADTIKGLAKGFQLDEEQVWVRAKESTGLREFEGNPLQQLIVTARDELKLSNADIERHARAAGFSLSKATVSNLTTGKHVTISEETVSALAKVLRVPARQIREASAQADRRVSYRLPDGLRERLTPQKWDQIVRIVEDILLMDDA